MKKSVIALICCFPLLTQAQNRIRDYNDITWLAFFVTPKINDKLSAHIEYQWRRTNWLQDWQQSLPRVGLTYKLNSQVSFQAGYAWIHTFPYGEPNITAVEKTFPEHRAYEQVAVTAALGRSTLLHRLRLEQRWLGRFYTEASEKPDTYVYSNRIRYMPRLDIPLNANKKLYAAVFDEIMINFGKNVGENVFDQNRFSLLMGYKINPAVRIEGGWINQIGQLSREVDNKNVYQHNNGIVINTYINFN